MIKRFWDTKIPTLLGLFIIGLGTVLTTFLANKGQSGQVGATNYDRPENVRITNISNNSFSVSYTTKTKTSGSINYGVDKNLGQGALDERDKEKGNLNEYTIHSINASNLSPSTKYYFTITSGGQTYTANGDPFEITTGPTLKESSNTQYLMKGKIISPNGVPPQEAIIYITSDNLQVASFLVGQNGTYSFLISGLRTSDLSSIYNFSEVQTLKMLVMGDSGKSNVIFSLSGIGQIPTITLSKDYDFTEEKNQNATPSAAFENSLSFPSSPATKSASPKILTPQKDQEFSSQLPIFRGTALPKQKVDIIIHSDEQIQASVITDSSGNWTYQSNSPLSPGTHTIIITSKNSAGILETITQSFVVFAQETAVSVSPSSSPSPTEVLPTESSTVSATQNQELPPTGNPSIIMVGILGIIISLIGGLLFLLTRGGI